jgi:hypothetical protein
VPSFERKISVEQLRKQLAEYDVPLLPAVNMRNELSLLNQSARTKHHTIWFPPYAESVTPLHSLERQADLMFSSEHMLVILLNPGTFLNFENLFFSLQNVLAHCHF